MNLWDEFSQSYSMSIHVRQHSITNIPTKWRHDLKVYHLTSWTSVSFQDGFFIRKPITAVTPPPPPNPTQFLLYYHNREGTSSTVINLMGSCEHCGRLECALVVPPPQCHQNSCASFVNGFPGLPYKILSQTGNHCGFDVALWRCALVRCQPA